MLYFRFADSYFYVNRIKIQIEVVTMVALPTHLKWIQFKFSSSIECSAK